MVDCLLDAFFLTQMRVLNYVLVMPQRISYHKVCSASKKKGIFLPLEIKKISVQQEKDVIIYYLASVVVVIHTEPMY